MARSIPYRDAPGDLVLDEDRSDFEEVRGVAIAEADEVQENLVVGGLREALVVVEARARDRAGAGVGGAGHQSKARERGAGDLPRAGENRGLHRRVGRGQRHDSGVAGVQSAGAGSDKS